MKKKLARKEQLDNAYCDSTRNKTKSMESYNIFLASVGYDVVLSFAHSTVKSVQSPERPLGTGCPTDK